ncbi:MAG: methyltransferase domain-containing protein [Chitinivibrionales bacterium]|nr:methyltransferase domain-containing protein [Chitinivibrionales bacterium]
MPPEHHCCRETEKKRYALHDNTLADARYTAYLNSVADEIAKIPQSNPAILDFGCGEQAVLGHILTARGLLCADYDPVYAIGAQALAAVYDIIVLCEVIEHLRDLQKEIALVRRLCKKNASIFIRTQIFNGGDFEGWWYKNDPTHINLFTPRAVAALAEGLEGRVVYCNNPSILIARDGW